MTTVTRVECTCDRCGQEEMGHPEGWSDLIRMEWTPHSKTQKPTVELCGACTRSLERWWNEGRPNPQRPRLSEVKPPLPPAS